ncbi:hypothetical protein [Streptosporangium sp. H16]|uniref:hypothetical protein n=1 Tax=Streptosporangium sp. H16 TaxID=3444184 RepID=UPI003F797F8F
MNASSRSRPETRPETHPLPETRPRSETRPRPENHPRPGSRSRSGAPARRRTTAPPSRWRAAGAVLAGIALAASAVGLQAFGSGIADHDAPLTSTGDINEEVTGSRISARVKAVHAAKAIAAKNAGGEQKRVTAKGIFIIVEVGATATWEPQQLGPPRLLTGGGHRYVASDRVDQMSTITHPYIQPGWWTEGVTVFEIPPGELPDSRILLAPSSGFIVEPNGPEIEIDLGLDEAAARRLTSTAKDVYELASRN